MTDFNLIRGGQINQSGDDRALFLKQYGGEVFTAFNEINAFGSRHFVRTLESGKSAQFPSIGGKSASYHTPGTAINGQPGNLAETTLTVDDFLHSSSSIAKIDEAMAHFDYRQPFSREDGRAIAREYDANVAQCGVQAGLTRTSRFEGTGDLYEERTKGFIEDRASTNSSASALKKAMIAVATNFDEKDIPEEDRNLFLRPAQYHLLGSDNETISSDYGGNGNRTLRVPQLYDFNLVKTNRLPNKQITGTYEGKYDVDGRNVVALAMLPFTVGTVKVSGMSVGMTGNDHLVRYNATLVSTKLLVGHGVLRPEGAAVIRTGAPS